MTKRPPIFFAWTKSFWLTFSGVALIIFGAPEEVLRNSAFFLAMVLPFAEVQIAELLTKLAPVALWALALQQRSGDVRPYTADPRALK